MKTKAFDCVAMKHEIQRRLREERPVSWAKRNELLRKTLRTDAHLSRLLDLDTRQSGGSEDDPS